MAETIVFSDSFTVSETKGAQSATVKRTVALKERLPGNERMFSRVYVSKEGLVTGGVFAEDAGLPDDPKFGGHEGMRVPSGTSEQRPADGKATIRYNTELKAFEANEDGVWILPFQGVNLRAVETDILPKVQSSQVYQLDVGNAAAPFKQGAFGRLLLVSKSVLSDEDKADGVLVNFNGTLYFGGVAVGSSQPSEPMTNDYFAFDTAPETTSTAVGTLSWNSTDDTLDLIQPNGTTLQLGQEAQIKIVNKTGAPIGNGQVVYLTGAQGNRVTAALAQANSFTKSQAIAVATNTIANNAEGFVTQLGLVRELNTEAFAEGTPVYLSATTAGAITSPAPQAPSRMVRVGYVVRSHAEQGSIFVAIDPTPSLVDLPDVSLASATNGQSMRLNTTTRKWEPYTPYTITVATTDPTGTPADGDIWLKITA